MCSLAGDSPLRSSESYVGKVVYRYSVGVGVEIRFKLRDGGVK